MIEIRKLLIFVFVLILLFYTCRLLYATRYKKDKAYIFIIMICGLSLSSIGTFLDMIGKIINEQVVYDVIRTCLTLGSIIYIIGIILWSGFTKNMIEELERMASTDPLTGALNRNGLERKFQTLIKKKHGFYLCVCDLDGTKSINDTFGHMEGDRFISNTVSIMTDLVGKNGWVSRIGGDEFIILLESNKFSEIDKIVVHLREKISGLYPEAYVGISMGYAQFPEDGEKFEELARKADTKMYNDKNEKQM
nr:GGDEF domain-containing protein [uncultured Acetobacterium sp.]